MRPGALLAVLALLGPGVRAQPPIPLGSDPFHQVQLAPPGCWDGLVLGASRTRRPGGPGATVEVWDFAYTEGARATRFRAQAGDLKRRLLQAWTLPPPSHGQLDLAEFMAVEASRPQKLDLGRVKALQDRFNRLPPAGSPVKAP